MLITLLELRCDVTLRDIEGNNAMASARCAEQALHVEILEHITALSSQKWDPEAQFSQKNVIVRSPNPWAQASSTTPT